MRAQAITIGMRCICALKCDPDRSFTANGFVAQKWRRAVVTLSPFVKPASPLFGICLL
jgi:hypothetical protein